MRDGTSNRKDVSLLDGPSAESYQPSDVATTETEDTMSSQDNRLPATNDRFAVDNMNASDLRETDDGKLIRLL